MSGAEGSYIPPQTDSTSLSELERSASQHFAAMQPHAVLLVLSEPELEILQVSDNAQGLIGTTSDTLLGRPLEALLDCSSARMVSARLQDPLLEPVLLHPLWMRQSSEIMYEGGLHRNATGLVLELQQSHEETTAIAEAFCQVQTGMQQLETAQTVSEVCRVAVARLRHLTGIDRVAVYQFITKTGVVVAEEQNGAFNTGQELHLPESQNPIQDSGEITGSRLHLVADLHAAPAQVVPKSNPLSNDPPELFRCAFYAPSADQADCLRRMGAAASLTIEVRVGQKLWGIVSCHHRSPRFLSLALLTACRLFVAIVGQRLSILTEQEEAVRHSRVRQVLSRSLELLSSSPAQIELSRCGELLLDPIGADGFALVTDAGVTLVGSTPNREQVAQLQHWLALENKRQLFYTYELPELMPSAASYRETANELLAFPLPHLSHGYAIWFRKRNVHWRPTELETVRDLQSLIIAIVLLWHNARELARAEASLQHATRELEQFAYVTSHDLKAPLRGIASLSKWIEEDLGSNITAETRRHLALMRGRVHRMEEMIGALLAYFRVGRIPLEAETVDVAHLISGVIDLLAPPSGFQILVTTPMPVFRTEKATLQRVLFNLIGNAIKHHGGLQGVVEISSRDVGKFFEFSVRDYGQGIDPRFHDRIFGMFQTLQSRDKIEGTGIGLALVKKIVDSKGGQISLESDLGAGSTFRFTWPKHTGQIIRPQSSSSWRYASSTQ